MKLQGLLTFDLEKINISLNENYVFLLANILETHFEDVANLNHKLSQKNQAEVPEAD